MFAKALLRQSFTQSRTFGMSAARVVARQQTLMAVCMRSFSANTANIEKAIQKLNKSLEKEIKNENENYSQLDDIETYLNESGFKFSEQESGVVLSLTKSVGDKTVEVQFEAR